MNYQETDIQAMKKDAQDIWFRYVELFPKIVYLAGKQTSKLVIEYATHGVGRRLGIIYRCFHNIFDIFPPERIKLLEDNDRFDVEINLHSFLINTYGLIDNIGLAIAYKEGILTPNSTTKERKAISIFCNEFNNKLKTEVKDYLRKKEIIDWYNTYAKNYRDALAHRIPPYIPSATINSEDSKRMDILKMELSSIDMNVWNPRYSKIIEEMCSIGKANPLFVHSFSEKAKPIYLHPQLISDYRTIEEIIDKVLLNYIQ